MTNRTELAALATTLGAAIREDAEGRIASVTWGGEVYGEGSMKDLLAFAEKARPVAAEISR